MTIHLDNMSEINYRIFFHLSLWIFIFICNLAMAKDYNLKVGLGGSIVGQKYSILEKDTTSLTSEPKILADGDYSILLGSHKLEGQFSSDVGNKSLWGNFRLQWRYDISQFTTEISEVVEGRLPYTDYHDVVGYFKHRFNLYLQQKLNTGKISTRLWVEGKNYENTGEFYYNYDLLRSKVEYDFRLFQGNVALLWTYSFRSVPDSAQANYDRRELQFSFSKLWKNANFTDFIIAYDRKNFPSEDRRGSYSSYYLYSNFSFPISNIFLNSQMDIENRNYDTEDEIYFDYFWLEFIPSIENEFGLWQAEIGPRYAIQYADEQFIGGTYNEIGLKFSLSNLDYGKFWLFLDITPGKRFYSFATAQDTSILYSDYMFVDISAMTSIWFTSSIRGDLSIIYSPEWHNRPSDDIQTSYFSFHIRYEF